MSSSALKLLAASGATDSATYVDDVFSTFLFSGTGSNQTITNGVDLSGEGGLVWVKDRSLSTSTSNHVLADTEQGATKYLIANSASSVNQNGTTLTSFNNDGFSVGVSSSFNRSNSDMASWTFRKAPGFFDVVTYTGNSSSSQTIPHNLGSVPGMIITKATSASTSWYIYHVSLGNNAYAVLNATEAASVGHPIWNNTTPTSTAFTVGSQGYNTNNNGVNYVAYLFAHDAQDFGTNEDKSIIKCGSYTGNGSSTGPIINLGFEPQWVLIKSASGTGDWGLVDIMRGQTADSSSSQRLKVNTSGAEGLANFIKLNSTGFQLTASVADYNGNGSEFIYMAIRRPHKPAEKFAATNLFTPAPALNASANGKVFATTYPVDLSIATNTVDNGVNWYTFDRMRGGGKYLWTDSDSVEASISNQDQFDHMDGLYTTSAYNYSSPLWIGYELRRAPGFFDIVAYGGNNTNGRAVPHNLGVTPEMMWVRARDEEANWYVYHAATGATKAIYLNGTQVPATSPGFWNDTAPTSSVFSVYSAFTNSSSYKYIAYLFASVDGISKVGTYTGTGGDLNVDCGFSAGARLVIIRRTDSTGDWYVYDSARGIAAGNDPYLLLNSTNGGVTNTDYIDPLASGFTVTSGAPAALNNTGGTYIFYAIA